MGSADSPVETGYTQVTDKMPYDSQRGFGWETKDVQAQVVKDIPDGKGFLSDIIYNYALSQFNDLNSDSVVSKDDLVFRADMPNGTYRVTVVIGDMAQAIGSIDLAINGQTIEKNVAAWHIGMKGPGNHRRMLQDPFGWWNPVCATVEVKDGSLASS